MAKNKRKKRQPPPNKRKVRVVQFNSRIDELVAEVFMEMSRRRKLSYREAMELALQQWCGVKIPADRTPAAKTEWEGLL